MVAAPWRHTGARPRSLVGAAVLAPLVLPALGDGDGAAAAANWLPADVALDQASSSSSPAAAGLIAAVAEPAGSRGWRMMEAFPSAMLPCLRELLPDFSRRLLGSDDPKSGQEQKKKWREAGAGPSLQGLIFVLTFAFLSGSLAGMVVLLLCWNPCMQGYKFGLQLLHRRKVRRLVPMLRHVELTQEQLPTEDTLCAVCLSTVREDVAQMNGLLVLPCGHVFHHDCIYPWFEERLSCPTCTRKISSFDSTFHARVTDQEESESLPTSSSASAPKMRSRLRPMLRLSCDHPLEHKCLKAGTCTKERGILPPQLHTEGHSPQSPTSAGALRSASSQAGACWLAFFRRFFFGDGRQAGLDVRRIDVRPSTPPV
eukprot:TRINITY_DN26545_c0_g2_i1.p1 TRINITY_DN26545_c0_g2~~TRINITY_DN26545_c0_g2_i1.p1  ORF type:complete len:370 (+),score=60.43 TRINITY_DN26545_c0_g2_i1:80-1189(+)